MGVGREKNSKLHSYCYYYSYILYKETVLLSCATQLCQLHHNATGPRLSVLAEPFPFVPASSVRKLYIES